MKSGCLRSKGLAITQHLQNSFQWGVSKVLTEKNHNTTLSFNTSYSKSFNKSNMMTNKLLTSKVQRLPLNYKENNQNMTETTPFFCNTRVKKRSKQPSNIEQLKKQIMYLEQEDMISNQFPNDSPCLESFNSQIQDKRGSVISINQSIKQNSKAFIIAPIHGNHSSSDMKFKRKYLKGKQRQKSMIRQPEDKQKEEKMFLKFQLIAPYRKYFQSNRFNKSKSCTMKIDQVLGKRITKLQKYSFETQN